MGELEAGFAKLQGEDFEYYMQTYSIILGRNSKKSTVDVDLASMGGGMNISRQHARIYYDFGRKRFALEVLSKNGCYVEGVLYLRGTSHVKLDSQDLLQIGEKKFYFLLPTKQISIAKPTPPPPPLPTMVAPAPIALAAPGGGSSGKKRSKQSKAEDGSSRKESKKRKSAGGEAAALSAAAAMQAGLSIASGSSGGNGVYPHPHSTPPPSGGPAYSSEKPPPYTSAEEREVVAAIGSVLSDLCGPGEWMPIVELFNELHAPEHYSSICSPAKVWKVVEVKTEEDGARPWDGLLGLLRRYPEHFIINIKTKGRQSAEYVSLVSLVS
ncbi:transcriptional activator FHA1 [Selaginella moellendorffii]|uniref:transcriptional activator FHA1 n=1 Tax=Selaginella moellendorffii TaxID=88036 RepID=UPI000D1C5711|nr:transcriptional activator FHA1 [Selaginella moellendorffii]|eukprot:XP_024539276.1 transcriptional activator FHA1 [Selaginella moellendorffii]